MTKRVVAQLLAGGPYADPRTERTVGPSIAAKPQAATCVLGEAGPLAAALAGVKTERSHPCAGLPPSFRSPNAIHKPGQKTDRKFRLCWMCPSRRKVTVHISAPENR